MFKDLCTHLSKQQKRDFTHHSAYDVFCTDYVDYDIKMLEYETWYFLKSIVFFTGSRQVSYVALATGCALR